MLGTGDSGDSVQIRPSGDSAQSLWNWGMHALTVLYLQTVPPIPSWTVGPLRAESW